MLGGESKREREVRADEGRGRMREKEMVWVLMEGKEESKVEREGDRARDGSDGQRGREGERDRGKREREGDGGGQYVERS